MKGRAAQIDICTSPRMCYALPSQGMSRISRRKFLQLGALALPAIGSTEQTRLRETNLKLNPDGGCRFIHFSDLHYQGDENFAEVVRAINELKPDFVCFTGDLVEDRRYAAEALCFIREIRAPVYGIPGNHDYWSRAPFSRI